jgi:hypothetical protein
MVMFGVHVECSSETQTESYKPSTPKKKSEYRPKQHDKYEEHEKKGINFKIS